MISMPKAIIVHSPLLDAYEKLTLENINTEIWKRFVYEGKETIYYVSNHGRVKNLSGRIIRPFHSYRKNTKRPAYLRVNLYLYDNDGRRYTKKFSIHRLVAMVFIPNPENLPEVNHKDGKIYNNFDTNLEWITQKGNIHHAIENDLRHPRKGTDHPNTDWTEHDVRLICQAIVNKWNSITAYRMCRDHLETPREYPQFRNLFFNVKQRRSWNHISKFYF